MEEELLHVIHENVPVYAAENVIFSDDRPQTVDIKIRTPCIKQNSDK